MEKWKYDALSKSIRNTTCVHKKNNMYQINIPNINGELTAEMTKEQVMKFHDELTNFINENYEELTKNDNE